MGHQKLLACQIEDKFQLPFTDPLSGKQAVDLTAMQLFEISTWLECLPTGKEGIQIRSLYVKLSTKQKPYRTFMRILY